MLMNALSRLENNCRINHVFQGVLSYTNLDPKILATNNNDRKQENRRTSNINRHTNPPTKGEKQKD